jgi:hypothetical protein
MRSRDICQGAFAFYRLFKRKPKSRRAKKMIHLIKQKFCVLATQVLELVYICTCHTASQIIFITMGLGHGTKCLIGSVSDLPCYICGCIDRKIYII